MPREDSGRLKLDPVALKDRRARAVQRMEAMIGYIHNENRCRANVLLSYFDEPIFADCGSCDVCRRNEGSKEIDGVDPLDAAIDHDLIRWQRDERGDRKRGKDGEA